ncbi:AAA family ATPase [bacterium]|nr:AAA family ATPase [bacterium]
MTNTIRELNRLFVSNAPFHQKSDELIEIVCDTLRVIKLDEIKHDDLCLYLLDMSNYKIKLSARTLVIVPNPDICEGDEVKFIVNEVKRIINLGFRSFSGTTQGNQTSIPDNFIDQITFILHFNHDRTFSFLQDDPLYNIVAMGQKEIESFVHSEFPRRMFIKAIKDRLSLTRISAFRYLGPVGDEMFYGRKLEINKILSSDRSFAVVGSRGIGKTSLIQHLYRLIQKEYSLIRGEKWGKPVIFFNCLNITDVSVVAEAIVREISNDTSDILHKTNFSLRDFFKKMYEWHGCRIIIFLDEVDALVPTPSGKKFFSEINAACDQGFLRVILSGYRDLLKDVVNREGSFFNFLETIRLKELEERDAKNLILEPMEELGISFKEKTEVIDHLLIYSGCYPRILQFYCQNLIEHLEKENKSVISMDDVITIEKSKNMVNHLVDIFMSSADKLDQLFVFSALSLPRKFTIEQLHEKIRVDFSEKGLPINLYMVDQGIEQLELSNIIERKGNEINFSYIILPKLLNEYVDVQYRSELLMNDFEVVSKLKEST